MKWQSHTICPVISQLPVLWAGNIVRWFFALIWCRLIGFWLYSANAARVPVAHFGKDVCIIHWLGAMLAQNPRMAHDLLACRSRLWVGHQKLTYEVFGFSWYGSPRRVIEVVVDSLDFLEEAEIVFVVERWLSGKQYEENYSKAPEITSLIVWFLFENFGRDIARGTTRGRSELCFIDKAGQAEISDLDDGLVQVFAAKEQVLRLYVSVNDAKLVAVD